MHRARNCALVGTVGVSRVFVVLDRKSPAAECCDVHHLRKDASVNRFCRAEMCKDLQPFSLAQLRSWDFNGLGMKPISRIGGRTRAGGAKERRTPSNSPSFAKAIDSFANYVHQEALSLLMVASLHV